jgi:hypothetical protein
VGGPGGVGPGTAIFEDFSGLWGSARGLCYFQQKSVFRAKVFEHRGFEPKSDFSVENCVSSQSL